MVAYVGEVEDSRVVCRERECHKEGSFFSEMKTNINFNFCFISQPLKNLKWREKRYCTSYYIQ